MLYSANLFSCGSLGSSLSNRSLLNGSLNGLHGSVLGNDLNGNLYLYLLVEVNGSLVVANLLGIVHGNNLAVDVEAFLSESLYYSSSAYRTVSYTSCRNLSFDYQLYTIESLSLLLSLSLEGASL